MSSGAALRYEYYSPLEVEDNLIVKFNIETGQNDPNTTQLHGTKKNNVQQGPGAAHAASGLRLFGGFSFRLTLS